MPLVPIVQLLNVLDGPELFAPSLLVNVCLNSEVMASGGRKVRLIDLPIRTDLTDRYNRLISIPDFSIDRLFFGLF